MSRTPQVWAVGLDFETAPLETRAKAIFSRDEEVLKITEGWSERVLISTCNRVELYGFGPEPAEEILQQWKEQRNLSSDDLRTFWVKEEADALAHLFQVTSSLSSMVIGETQISGQVRKAYELAVEKRWVGPFLHRIFQKAFKVSKRVRSCTDVGKLVVSIPSIGVKLAERVLGDLSQRRVAVFGVGEIGRVAAEHFASAQPVELRLYNRTHSVAEDLAEKFRKEGVHAVAISDVSEALRGADIIISAVGGDTQVIGLDHLKALDAEERDLFVLDLSVPPSIPEYEGSNLFSYRVDDLRSIAEENQSLRGSELSKALEMIQEEVHICLRGLGEMAIAQVFQNLRTRQDAAVSAELAHLKRRLPGLTEGQWEEVERTAYRIRELSGRSEESLLQFFRTLFKI